MELTREHVAERQMELRGVQIISVALLMGAVGFLFAVFFLSQTLQVPAKPDAVRTVELLCGVQVLMAPGAWLMAGVLYRMRVRGNLGALKALETPDALVAELMSRVRGGTILALALFEGQALFGTVVCFLATQLGVLDQTPYVWGGCLSTLVMGVAVLVLFPTATGIAKLGRELQQRAELEG